MYLKIYTTDKSFAIRGEYDDLKKTAFDIQQSQKVYIDIGNDTWIARDKITAMRIIEYLHTMENGNVVEVTELLKMKAIE